MSYSIFVPKKFESLMAVDKVVAIIAQLTFFWAPLCIWVYMTLPYGPRTVSGV